jgi:acyl-coenzyme A synthetase/AMP-(fatty) acid ligase
VTGDAVEVDGEWIRVLGRHSDVINVGGEKVHPAQVEDVLLELDGVIDVEVHGEPNAIVGQVVVARVRLATGETAVELARRARAFCRGRLAPFMVPQRFVRVDAPLHGDRQKKLRGGRDAE